MITSLLKSANCKNVLQNMAGRNKDIVDQGYLGPQSTLSSYSYKKQEILPVVIKLFLLGPLAFYPIYSSIYWFTLISRIIVRFMLKALLGILPFPKTKCCSGYHNLQFVLEKRFVGLLRTEIG